MEEENYKEKYNELLKLTNEMIEVNQSLLNDNNQLLNDHDNLFLMLSEQEEELLNLRQSSYCQESSLQEQSIVYSMINRN